MKTRAGSQPLISKRETDNNLKEVNARKKIRKSTDSFVAPSMRTVSTPSSTRVNTPVTTSRPSKDSVMPANAQLSSQLTSQLTSQAHSQAVDPGKNRVMVNVIAHPTNYEHLLEPDGTIISLELSNSELLRINTEKCNYTKIADAFYAHNSHPNIYGAIYFGDIKDLDNNLMKFINQIGKNNKSVHVYTTSLAAIRSLMLNTSIKLTRILA